MPADVLPEEARKRIVTEEVFRKDYADQLSDARRSWWRRIADFANAKFTIWLLGTVLVGLLVHWYQQYAENLKEQAKDKERLRALRIEMVHRLEWHGVLTNVYNGLHVINDAFEGKDVKDDDSRLPAITEKVLPMLRRLNDILEATPPRNQSATYAWVATKPEFQTMPFLALWYEHYSLDKEELKGVKHIVGIANLQALGRFVEEHNDPKPKPLMPQQLHGLEVICKNLNMIRERLHAALVFPMFKEDGTPMGKELEPPWGLPQEEPAERK